MKYGKKDEELINLHGILCAGNVNGLPHLYENVFRLASLSKLAGEYGLNVPVAPEHHRWNKRPLSAAQLMYAYGGVTQVWSMLPILKLCFEPKEPVYGSSWKQASLRYADMF